MLTNATQTHRCTSVRHDPHMALQHLPPISDITGIIQDAAHDLRTLRDEKILVTGGTGFVGTWLVATLVEANSLLDLGLSVMVMSRDPETFAQRSPTIARSVELISGDVLEFPPTPAFTTLVHAATPAVATLNDTDPDMMYAVIVDGMRNALRACRSASRPRLLFTSSGAVYGPQPPDCALMPEIHSWDTENSANAYATGKRDAEQLVLTAQAEGIVSARVSRLFAFAGPLLPLDGSFAIGNFIRDALERDTITVHGDGTAVRSYMYAADLVRALLAILVRGTPGSPYNVGSEVGISISDLAACVRRNVNPSCGIEVLGRPSTALPTGAGSRYVPDCSRLRNELAFTPSINLDEAIRRSAQWAAE
jgi:nucleoside-diphosphate-sugar epimerase